jgi:hypothetical protein
MTEKFKAEVDPPIENISTYRQALIQEITRVLDETPDNKETREALNRIPNKLKPQIFVECKQEIQRRTNFFELFAYQEVEEALANPKILKVFKGRHNKYRGECSFETGDVEITDRALTVSFTERLELLAVAGNLGTSTLEHELEHRNVFTMSLPKTGALI